MDPKPFKPDTTDGITDSFELKESPDESQAASKSKSASDQPESPPPLPQQAAPKEKRTKRRGAADRGIAVTALVITVVLSIVNYLIGPPDEKPRNIGYLAQVPKTGDALTLLMLKMRLSRGIFLSSTRSAANMDIANYYLWTGNFAGAQSYLTDLKAVGSASAPVRYSELGMKLDQKQWKQAAQIADQWLECIESPTENAELELIRLAYLRASRLDDAKRVQDMIDRGLFRDDSRFDEFETYSASNGLVAVTRIAGNAMNAGEYKDAARYWQFVLASPISGDNPQTSYEHEKARLMLPVASLLSGDKAAAAKQFPAALKSLRQYGDWFSDKQKSVVYKYYASLLRQQGAGTESIKYQEMARRLLNERPVKPWWDEKIPIDPWNQVSL